MNFNYQSPIIFSLCWINPRLHKIHWKWNPLHNIACLPECVIWVCVCVCVVVVVGGVAFSHVFFLTSKMLFLSGYILNRFLLFIFHVLLFRSLSLSLSVSLCLCLSLSLFLFCVLAFVLTDTLKRMSLIENRHCGFFFNKTKRRKWRFNIALFHAEKKEIDAAVVVVKNVRVKQCLNAGRGCFCFSLHLCLWERRCGVV